MSEKAEDKINEIVARLNKLAKKHREIDARMKKLEAASARRRVKPVNPTRRVSS